MDIIVQDLTKNYGDVKVLDKYNTRFKEGKVSFIMGTSGIGKTTLIRILAGVEKADSGKISGIKDRRISVVFQDDSLCSNLSLLANIKLVLPKGDISELNEKVTLLGLEDCFYKRISELSGGMKRRVAILRALMYKFDILIMDEPFKGLDTETKENTINLIKNEIRNKTVIIITHDIEETNYFEEYDILNLPTLDN